MKGWQLMFNSPGSWLSFGFASHRLHWQCTTSQRVLAAIAWKPPPKFAPRVHENFASCLQGYWREFSTFCMRQKAAVGDCHKPLGFHVDPGPEHSVTTHFAMHVETWEKDFRISSAYTIICLLRAWQLRPSTISSLALCRTSGQNESSPLAAGQGHNSSMTAMHYSNRWDLAINLLGNMSSASAARLHVQWLPISVTCVTCVTRQRPCLVAGTMMPGCGKFGQSF